MDAAGTMRGLELTVVQLEEGARTFVVESTAMVTREAQVNASSGSHPRGQGHTPGTGPGPNVVSGTLRRSIKPTPVTRISEGWSGTTGPTAIYGRKVELGDAGWASGVKFPYLGPAIRLWKARARELMRQTMRAALHG